MTPRTSVAASLHESPTLSKQVSPTDHHSDRSAHTTFGEKPDDSEDTVQREIPADEIPGLREAITKQVQDQLRSGKLPSLQMTTS